MKRNMNMSMNVNMDKDMNKNMDLDANMDMNKNIKNLALNCFKTLIATSENRIYMFIHFTASKI